MYETFDPTPPSSQGAKTMLCRRWQWSPILLSIVDVKSLWIHSKKVGDIYMAGKEYVSAGKKHDQ